MPDRSLNVALVISSLSGGGAERVLVLLAKGLVDRGHHVSVVTIFGAEHDFYELPGGVRRMALDLGGESATIWEKVSGNVRRVRALRAAISNERPDVVISFMPETNVLTLLATGRLAPVIVTEHINPRMLPLGRIWAMLRRITYRRAARLVSVSAGVDRCFEWLPSAKRAVIHNPICAADMDALGEPLAKVRTRRVVSMGRLDAQKGFDLLIEAFSRLAPKFPDWELVILGEGHERAKLELLVAERGLGATVRLPGALKNPFPTLRGADLFVLSSRFEGFGNALVEAMACGLAVIATDCPSGPAEIIRDRVDGRLVPALDVPALAVAMAELMADDGERARLATAAVESARRFDLDRVMVSWVELLAAVTT